MKKLFCALMITLVSGTIANAQGKAKANLIEAKATQIAKERTEKDAREYHLTAEQQKGIYQVNLEIGRKIARVGDHANDNRFKLEMEQTHFHKCQPLIKSEQMQKFMEDHRKAMDEMASAQH